MPKARPRSLCDTSSTRACPVLDIYTALRVGSVNTGQPLGKGLGVDAAGYIPDLLGPVPFGAQRFGFFFVRKGDIELGAHGGSFAWLAVHVLQGYPSGGRPMHADGIADVLAVGRGCLQTRRCRWGIAISQQMSNLAVQAVAKQNGSPAPSSSFATAALHNHS